MHPSSMPARASLSLAVALAIGALASPAHAACKLGIDGGKTVNLPDFTPNASGVYTPTEKALGINASQSEYGANPQFQWTLTGPGSIRNANQANATYVAADVGPAGGSATVTLTVTSTGCTKSDLVNINLSDAYTPNANQAPHAVATATPAQALEGQRVSLDGSASFDPDRTPLSYVWTQVSGPKATLENANAAVASFVAPVLSADATLGFQLEVSDGTLKNAATTLVSISWTNRAPTAVASCPAYVDEGGNVVLDGSASSDSDDGIVAYHWEQTTSLPEARLPAGGSWDAAVVSFPAPALGYQQVGDMPFRLTVTDKGGLRHSTDCTVMVQDVTAPAISVPSDIVAEAGSAAGAEVVYASSALDNVDGPLPAACTPASGSLFALDRATPVACHVTDSAGNAASAGFSVSVVDTTAPALQLPLSFAVEATGPVTTVDFSATSLDRVDGAQPADCAPVSGSGFRLGTTAVSCKAQDAHGNVATAQAFEVSVLDTRAPEFSGVSDDLVLEATSPAGAVLTYALPVATDLVDGDVVVNCTPASGSTVGLGASTVDCLASDLSSNTAHAGFGVTVQDTTAPVIAAHGNEIAEATGPDGAFVGYVLPGVSDAVSTTLVATCAPAPGSRFALGTTNVSCNATDAAGNAAAPVGFQVEVRDTTAPLMLNVNVDRIVEATSAAGATVDFVLPSAVDLVDGDVPVTCSAAPGSVFPLGTTTVTCGASDKAGNAAAAVSFAITVRDTTAPALTLPDTVTARATANSAANVSYVASASDIVDGDVAVTCSPASGGSFPVGTTTVDCSATDAHGNKASGSFKVSVGYGFTGFLQPVDNLPAVNAVKAGSAVPVKFSLAGNQGLAIMQAGYPKSGVVLCSATTAADVEETVAAGSSSLQYDATSDQYVYVWKTDRSWTGSCRVLQITLKDGTTKSAMFKFK